MPYMMPQYPPGTYNSPLLQPYPYHGGRMPASSAFYIDPPANDFRIIHSQPDPSTSSNAGIIVKKLHELADTGEIMVELTDLEKALVENAAKITKKMTSTEFSQGLQEAEDKEMIIVTKRQFGSKPPQKFASVKLKVVSLESVMWILKSLEKDEMTPVERAVQSRFKESFGMKMCSQEWAKLVEVLKNTRAVPREPKDPEYEFDVIEVDDTVSGCKTCSIYPKGKRWTSVDMSLKSSEINQELFKEFLNFIESYFLGSEEDEKAFAKGDEKCIPGGRYGCAQFVKACGTTRLRSCSLGQLAQFIQFAINEDILRYQRTLLVWNKNPMKAKKHEISSSDSEAVRKQKEKMSHKLNITKQAIIEVLTENPAGLSLAQLPLHLKYKLPFPLDLNELGFVKLKELLVTMADQIKIELRGHNHPFARLAHKPSIGGLSTKTRGFGSGEFSTTSNKGHVQRYSDDFIPAVQMPNIGQRAFVDFNRHLEMIRNCIYGLLQEFPPGIDSTKLPLLLYMRLGLTFDWFVFGCSTLLEFLQKYITPYYELEFISINPYDSNHFVLRHKEAYRRYATYYNQQQQQQYSPEYYPVHYRFETDPNVLSSLPSAYSAANNTGSSTAHSVQPSMQVYGPRGNGTKSGAGSISIPDPTSTGICILYYLLIQILPDHFPYKVFLAPSTPKARYAIFQNKIIAKSELLFNTRDNDRKAPNSDQIAFSVKLA
eukprot:TRINITY_DN1452_c0_g1_i1.p2 TRINITY_DN1452_c0_g1~~TRINITY_DN1452_c0_g1_i1.p2  ORF type:complete len:713 (+),score=60.85 TRINITY_DN1452_c0_g1_i1:7148-9286(+)